MSDLKIALRQFIQENFIMGAGSRVLGDAESLMENQVLDSTGFLELVVHLEETYQITVTEEEMIPENLDSIDKLSAYLGSKMGASQLQ